MEFLKLQCSLHMPLKAHNSVKLGVRPSFWVISSNSSAVRRSSCAVFAVISIMRLFEEFMIHSSFCMDGCAVTPYMPWHVLTYEDHCQVYNLFYHELLVNN